MPEPALLQIQFNGCTDHLQRLSAGQIIGDLADRKQSALATRLGQLGDGRGGYSAPTGEAADRKPWHARISLSELPVDVMLAEMTGGQRADLAKLLKVGSATGKASSSPAVAVKPAATATPARPAAPAVNASAIAAKATAAERVRWATVFASAHSKGRERGCVALLTASNNWPASAIVANLPAISTDADTAQALAAARQAEINTSWAQANAKIGNHHA